MDLTPSQKQQRHTAELDRESMALEHNQNSAHMEDHRIDYLDKATTSRGSDRLLKVQVHVPNGSQPHLVSSLSTLSANTQSTP